MRIIGFFTLLVTFCSCDRKPDRQDIPPSITVEAPTMVTQTVRNDLPVLQFHLKGNSIWYKYDTAISDEGIKKVAPQTLEALIEIIDRSEKEHKIIFSDHNDRIIIKGVSNTIYSSFKLLKQAFKARGIYKFKIATVDEEAR